MSFTKLDKHASRESFFNLSHFINYFYLLKIIITTITEN